ncbi:MAG: ribonuclease HII [Bacteroidales bacterium]|nr:ribonuclease HII [Bacteroidales bacterium]
MLSSNLHKNTIEAGCDEAGRGCLAGPVFAAAVILPEEYSHPVLNDSKKLSHKQRNILRLEIEKNAIAWAVAECSAEEIDSINILNASFLAMHRAVSKLGIRPQHLLIDGNRFRPYEDIPHTCIIKGDGKFFSIAAASVLAKTYRDEYMEKLDIDFPQYNWKTNKGYPTLSHRKALAEFGVCAHHRHSFRLFDEQLSLEFK